MRKFVRNAFCSSVGLAAVAEIAIKDFKVMYTGEGGNKIKRVAFSLGDLAMEQQLPRMKQAHKEKRSVSTLSPSIEGRRRKVEIVLNRGIYFGV